MRWLPLLLLPCLASAELRKLDVTYANMDCASCAAFLEKRMKRHRSVESARLDAAKGILYLELRPANTAKLEQLVALTEQGGSTARQVSIEADGVADASGAFRISESGETLPVGDGKALLQPFAGQRRRVEAIAQKSPDGSFVLSIKRVSAPESATINQ